MPRDEFSGANILVVGGAGFVGSNLVHQLLPQGPRSIYVVDNLLSSEIENVPVSPAIHFTLGSIVEDRVLENLPRDLDYVFHLACYHGNQSSIANKDKNTIPTLKLFDRLKSFGSLEKIVYAAAGCAVLSVDWPPSLLMAPRQSCHILVDAMSTDRMHGPAV